MITSIRMVNFKNFVDETLRLGPFTVVVGTNASGKSNIRDAFRILHGIGRGYTLMEVVGGKWGTGGQREWAPIRGAANEIARLSHPDSRWAGSRFSFHVELEMDGTSVDYTIEIAFNPRPLEFRVQREVLRVESRALYETIGVGRWVALGALRRRRTNGVQPMAARSDAARCAAKGGADGDSASTGEGSCA